MQTKNSRLNLSLNLNLVPSGDHRPDLYLIAVPQYLVFRHEFIAANDEVGFLDELQLMEQVFHPLGTLHLDRAGRMTELHAHRMIIRRLLDDRQADSTDSYRIMRTCYTARRTPARRP